MPSSESSWRGALAELGVTDTTLTAAEQRGLDEQGYLLLPRLLDERLVVPLREAFEVASIQEHGTGAHARGTRHAGGERLQGELFSAVYTHPKLLAAAVQVLGRPFRWRGVNGRDPLPGHGGQALHADWGPREAGDPYFHLNSIWLLDDFTPDNGGTRLVPGSHLRPGRVPRALSDPESRHPEEVVVTAPAGSALIFNAHLLHSGTRNRSRGSRRALTCSFVARDAPYYGGLESMEQPLGRADWLSAAARQVLGLRGEGDDLE